MLGNFPPFTTMQELNLDWILTKIKNILRFVPDDGAVGQILRRTPSGAEWSDEQGAGGSVTSVNGMQGAVVLGAADVGALPDTTVIPDSTSDLVNDSGFVDAAGAAAAAPVQSVNGQTGSVSLTIPDSTSDLVNDSGFVNAAGAAAAAPVQSVNGQTGSVSLTIPGSTSDLVNDSGFVDAAGAAAAAPVQSVNGNTGAVTVGFGTDTTFSLPKTFTNDAIVNVVLELKSVSGAAAYYYIRRNGSDICGAYLGNANGGVDNICFPIRKGDTISLYSSNNISRVTLYEFPIT